MKYKDNMPEELCESCDKSVDHWMVTDSGARLCLTCVDILIHDKPGLALRGLLDDHIEALSTKLMPRIGNNEKRYFK